MADNVKWIKFIVGTFDGESFKKIKRAKIGGVAFRDKLTATWFELLDLSAKCNHEGMLINSDEIAYETIEDIATQIDREEKEIELCIAFFIKEKMIEIVDNVYMLSNWNKYQSVEGLDKIREKSRLRTQKCRANRRLSGANLTSSNATNEEVGDGGNATSNATNNDKTVTDNIGEPLPVALPSYSYSYILFLNDLIDIIQKVCPDLAKSHQQDIDAGQIGKIEELEQTLAILQMTAEEYEKLFKHVSKTYVVKPNYIKQCNILWVLNNISKVNSLSEDKLEIKQLASNVHTSRDLSAEEISTMFEQLDNEDM